MPLGRTHSVALLGIEGAIVEVEADISAQLPSFVLIGLPDAALGEARDRVRAAAGNSGTPLSSRKLTVNLSPAALPKHGASFDLAIAVAALAAAGTVRSESVDRVVHLGELGLDGRLRPVRGVLPAVLAAARAGFATVVVPAGNAAEARLVPGIEVVAAASLREVAIWHGAELPPIEVDPILPTSLEEDDAAEGDLGDVIGNSDAVEALQVAAAGGHHLLMLGPPGTGKTMLASRLPGLLPDLDPASALELASIRSLSGRVVGSLSTRPPFEAPHHGASAAALVGGGSGILRPGAASRATSGVLFLDEAPEFQPAVLDALRQPLESGVVRVARANATATFPARFQLVLAANPCPCGKSGVRNAECTCTAMARRRYIGRLSGPLLDRVDIRFEVPRVTVPRNRSGAAVTTTAAARSRVLAARDRALDRLRDTPWRVNAEVPGSWLRSEERRLPRGALRGLDMALDRGTVTMRGYDKIVRLAWTVADISGLERPGADEVGRAMALRRVLP